MRLAHLVLSLEAWALLPEPLSGACRASRRVWTVLLVLTGVMVLVMRRLDLVAAGVASPANGGVWDGVGWETNQFRPEPEGVKNEVTPSPDGLLRNAAPASRARWVFDQDTMGFVSMKKF